MTAYQLPFPPSANTYYRHVMMGQRPAVLISSKGRQYQVDVAIALNGEQAINGRLRVSIQLHAPNRRKYDIDNRIKPLLDAIQACGMIEDDEAIDELRVLRGPIGDGVALVTIEKLENDC